MNYIERCLPLSRVKRAMKSQEELISIDHAMWKEICEAYVGAPVAEETTEPPPLPSPAATPDRDPNPIIPYDLRSPNDPQQALVAARKGEYYLSGAPLAVDFCAVAMACIRRVCNIRRAETQTISDFSG